MCSGPSSSMISVPDAALFPSTPRPVRRANSEMISGATPFGNVGNARSRTMPIISQWPVTESFPAEASAILPYAACRPGQGSAAAGPTRGPPTARTGEPACPPRSTRRSKPSLRSVGSCSGTRFAILPTVLLPWSPYAAASGSSPTPTLSITMTMARRNGALRVREVIGHRFRRLDAGDRMLEDHVIGAALVQHEREAVEVLDASLELAAVHHPDRDGELFAPHVVEEDVLNVRLRLGVRGGRHMNQ